MKKIILLVLLISSMSAFAQKDSSWTNSGMIGINGTQSGFKNWAQGGENTLAATANLLLEAHYKKDKNIWDNMLIFNLGTSQIGDGFYKKTEDKIEFNSKFGHQATKNWYYSALFNFKTQSLIGYEYTSDTTEVMISGFLAPAYIKLGLGMDYKPNKHLSLYLSPTTARWIVVNDQNLANAGAFGVEKAVLDTAGNIVTEGKMIKTEVGAYLRLAYEKDIFKNVNFATILELYSDYLSNPQNIDVDWQVVITMKVNNFLNAQIKTHLIYDDDTPVGIDDSGNGKFDRFGPRTQFNEQLSLGLVYKFGAKK